MNKPNNISIIKEAFSQTKEGISQILNNIETLSSIEEVSKLLIETINKESIIFSCGNGGSMCDSMHFAEELTARYRNTRRALPAVAISDPAFLTCVGNDFGFDYIFSRFIEGNAKKEDILFAISTSGKSKNILEASKVAKKKSMVLISLTGNKNSPLAEISDLNISTPCGEYSDRIQELHSIVIHILIEIIENSIFYSS